MQHMNSGQVPATVIFTALLVIILLGASRTTYTLSPAKERTALAACDTPALAREAAERRACPCQARRGARITGRRTPRRIPRRRVIWRKTPWKPTRGQRARSAIERSSKVHARVLFQADRPFKAARRCRSPLRSIKTLRFIRHLSTRPRRSTRLHLFIRPRRWWCSRAPPWCRPRPSSSTPARAITTAATATTVATVTTAAQATTTAARATMTAGLATAARSITSAAPRYSRLVQRIHAVR